MSAVTPPATTDDAVASELAAETHRRHRPRRRVLVAAAAAVVVVAGGLVAVADPFGSHGSSKADNAAPTSRATVTKRDLSSQTNVNGTLGYTGSYSVVGQSEGTIASLPTVGQVVSQGQPLYEVNATPVVLLYGSTPAYRSLSAGMTGPDVAQLNFDLVALGYATSSQLDPTSDLFSSATATAL